MPEPEFGVFVVCRHRWLCLCRYFCDAAPPASDSLCHVGALWIMPTAAPDTMLVAESEASLGAL
jgi:hypothetical protein